MVKIGFIQDEPIICAALGVQVSQTPFEKGDIKTLYKQCLDDKEKSKKLVNMIMNNHKHMILGDFLPYVITLEDISRLGAIYLWRNVNIQNLIFGAGIEASLRVIRPNRYKDVVSDLGKEAFKVYERALELEVPEGDARYVLPEGTLTRMIFSAPPRYLVKLANTLKIQELEELKEIGENISKIVKDNFGLEVPEETMPSTWNFWGNRKVNKVGSHKNENDIHSVSLNKEVNGSLAMHAQLVRQRQFLCEIEPLEKISRKGKFVIPPSFPEEIKKQYKEVAEKAKEKQLNLMKEKDLNFVYSILIGQEASAMIYGKGSGVIETSKSRSEGVAQWEIRNKVGIPVTRELMGFEDLRKEIGPRCWREGICIEPTTFKTKKSICPAFYKSKGKWEGTLEELLKTLEVSDETFSV